MAVWSVVELLNVVKSIGLGYLPGLVNAFADALFFRPLKNDSMTALAQ